MPKFQTALKGTSQKKVRFSSKLDETIVRLLEMKNFNRKKHKSIIFKKYVLTFMKYLHNMFETNKYSESVIGSIRTPTKFEATSKLYSIRVLYENISCFNGLSSHSMSQKKIEYEIPLSQLGVAKKMGEKYTCRLSYPFSGMTEP